MSVTSLAEVNEQIQKFWSPLFMDELRQSMLLAALVNREYEGQIKQGGDTVYVSQVNAPTGENRTVGVDADSFNTEKLSTSRIPIVADKRAVAAYEFADLAELQSQIGSQESKIREALMFAVDRQVNNYLYSLVAPSSSSPAHILNSVSDFNGAALGNCRKLAAQARWSKKKGGWWTLADPSYYTDLLNATTMTSKDYGADDAPVIGGQIVNKRFGFNVLEDDGLAVDQAVSFHPDFMHLVHQTLPSFEVSSQHGNKKFGYIISVNLIYGAKLGIAGSKKHILTNASGSATSVVMAA